MHWKQIDYYLDRLTKYVSSGEIEEFNMEKCQDELRKHYDGMWDLNDNYTDEGFGDKADTY